MGLPIGVLARSKAVRKQREPPCSPPHVGAATRGLSKSQSRGLGLRSRGSARGPLGGPPRAAASVVPQGRP
eukprot:5850981-Alexandrium_andersonii.AAC.1